MADEPTSALDVTVQRRILDLIDELRRESGTAVLLVTHDLGVAADRADRLVVLQNGRIQEQGAVKDVLAAPRSAYTRRLLADAPSLGKPRPARPAIAQRRTSPSRSTGLTHDFPVTGGEAKSFRAVDDVSFKVRRGTTHAIVGESGSGKTTAIRSVVGFIKPTAGRILIDGVDLATLKGEKLRQFRKHIQLVYQNPYGSLDPRQTIARIVEEPLLNFEPIPAADRARKVRDMLDRVGLSEAFLERHPRALSGGQRQRVAIARALVLDPRVLVLDEAVSALDVTVQAQILSLLDELQKTLGLTYLFVSHDLAVVRQISDTVSVHAQGPTGRRRPHRDRLRPARQRLYARADRRHSRPRPAGTRWARPCRPDRTSAKVEPMTTFPIKRLGFFTRLLDQVDAAERYRLATEQIVHAEKFGFDSAWIAQHHFHEGEGGLPAPFVFLAHAAAHTSRIRLGTGIVTLPLELPIRVAEDAVVPDLMSGGRLEVGVGPGGNLTAFTAFGLESDQRHVAVRQQPRHPEDRLVGRRAGRRRQALSVEPDPGRPHLAGDLHASRAHAVPAWPATG